MDGRSSKLTPSQMALRALAEQATPGPWEPTAVDESVYQVWAPNQRGVKRALLTWVHQQANAAYIAAAHPTAILALLDDVTTATARLAEVEDRLSRYQILNGEVIGAQERTLLEQERARAEQAEAALTAMTQERDADAVKVLEMAAQVAFVCGTDTPDTERRARAALVTQLTAARARTEAVEAALREAREWLRPNNRPGIHTRREMSAYDAVLVIDAALATPPATGHDAGGEV